MCKSYAQQAKDSLHLNQDSLWVENIKSHLGLQIKPQLNLPSIPSFALDSIPAPSDSAKNKKSPLLYFQQGYIQYNVNYRSRIDTPYSENDIIQHLRSANGSFVIAGSLPLSVSYFERQSNSSFFRDYRDVRVDVNGPELRRLQRDKLKKALLARVNEMDDPLLKPNINGRQREHRSLKLALQNPELVQLLIESKDHLIWRNELDPNSKWKDSILGYSKKYVDAYEAKEKYLDSLKAKIDSMNLTYNLARKRIQQLQSIINRQFNLGSSLPEINKSLRSVGLDEDKLRMPGILYSLQHFSAGRVSPNVSPLTLKNVNVKGIDAALGNDFWYAAITAGTVDFRLRDFVSKNQKLPKQVIYLGTVGLGTKEGTHLFLTGYKGKKQVYSFNDPSVPIAGVSGELQYVWQKRYRLSVEVAQSSVPSKLTGEKNQPIQFNDKTAAAYNVHWKSSFSKLKATAEGFYQKSGINFYSFNSYRTNAETESWQLKYEQFFFGRQLRMTASARKNDFSNPLIDQKYSSNTVFKTLQATFKRKWWPTVSVGYLPSSQLIVLDNQVFEAHYQTFTGLINHSYKISTAPAITNIFYSRFYNSGEDSNFLYYKANHISVSQNIFFSKFTSIATVTFTKSPEFSMLVLQLGNAWNIGKRIMLEGGVRVNHLDNGVTKSGLYGRSQVNIPFVGTINMSFDDAYLPGLGRRLARSQQFNAGLTRRIK